MQNVTRIPMDTTSFIPLHMFYYPLKYLRRIEKYLMTQSKINSSGVREKNKEYKGMDVNYDPFNVGLLSHALTLRTATMKKGLKGCT